MRPHNNAGLVGFCRNIYVHRKLREPPVLQKNCYLNNNLSIFNGEVGRVFETPILDQHKSKNL